MIDAAMLLAFLDFLDAMSVPQTAQQGAAERAWAIQQVRGYVQALVEQPTLREIEASSS